MKDFMKFYPDTYQLQPLLTGYAIENVNSNGVLYLDMATTRETAPYVRKWYEAKAHNREDEDISKWDPFKAPNPFWITKLRQIKDVNKFLPPCIFCKSNNKFSGQFTNKDKLKELEERGDHKDIVVARAYGTATIIGCVFCNYYVRGDALCDQTSAWVRWEKSYQIIRSLRGAICPSNRIILADGTELPEAKYEYEGNGIYYEKERGILCFADAGLRKEDSVVYKLCKQVPIVLGKRVKYFKIGKATLLNHRKEYIPSFLHNIHFYQEENQIATFDEFRDYQPVSSLD